MLKTLFIKDYALIKELEIDFSPGFNVITGETGAGKSVIVGALTLLLGGKGDPDLVRSGAEKLYLEASFSVSDEIKGFLVDLDLNLEDELIISCEMGRDKKSKYRLNTRLITRSNLKDLTNRLFDIHGQHEHQSLLDNRLHLNLLDSLAEEQSQRIKEEVFQLFTIFKEKERLLFKINRSEAERLKEIDFLKFQLDEIAALNLLPGEEEELQTERELLLNANQIAEKGNLALDLLAKEEGALDLLREALRELQEIKEVSPSLQENDANLNEGLVFLEEAERGLSDFLSNVEADPLRLSEIEERLAEIERIKRKHNDIKKREAEMKKELSELESSEMMTKNLTAEIEDLSVKLLKKAKLLSQKRKDLSKKLEERLVSELKFLNMGKTLFKVSHNLLESPTEKGLDEVEFLISTNPGEALKPLSKIASGGEISRFMLALKSILFKGDQISGMIFDEIDVGIGGATAISIGERLKHLSLDKQVISITHLPQIAAKADHHLLVEKRDQDAKTQILVKELKEKELRVKELARMLTGRVSEKSLKNAEEMLE